MSFSIFTTHRQHLLMTSHPITSSRLASMLTRHVRQFKKTNITFIPAFVTGPARRQLLTYSLWM